MSEEEVKEKILGNAYIQTSYNITAAVCSLQRVLIEKGILNEADINRIKTYAEDQIKGMNESSIQEITEELKRRENNEKI